MAIKRTPRLYFGRRLAHPLGAGMQIAYNLEKRDGAWVVQKSQSVDG